MLCDYLMARDQLPADALNAVAGTTEDSHNAVAAVVASGDADAGLGIEAAAAAYGLGFVPLIEEDYFLVCLKDALDHPAVAKLRGALAAGAWPSLLAGLPGYAPAERPGEVLSLTRALPWWHYRTAKRAGAAARR